MPSLKSLGTRVQFPPPPLQGPLVRDREWAFLFDSSDPDGELTIGVRVNPEDHVWSPRALANPKTVQVKEQLWTAIRPLLQSLPDP